MFKKRSVKGQKRVVARDSSNSDDSDYESSNIVVKKQKSVIDDKELKQDSKIKEAVEHVVLSKNEEATKVDILNQEIIDNERKRKSENTKDETNDDKIYKGQSNYTKFIKPKSNMDEKGPKKQASNVRSTTVFDFQRDVCKDYRQTGFCGYGDSCKFLHARDDFKAGWKLKNDWDLETKAKEAILDKTLKDIPFKCVICKLDYTNPIKTSCGHFFCEMCFLKRNKKNSSCAICGKDTNGIALPAKELKELLNISVRS